MVSSIYKMLRKLLGEKEYECVQCRDRYVASKPFLLGETIIDENFNIVEPPKEWKVICKKCFYGEVEQC